MVLFLHEGRRAQSGGSRFHDPAHAVQHGVAHHRHDSLQPRLLHRGRRSIGPNYEVEFLADVSLGKAENLAKAGVRLEGRKLVFEKPLYDMWSEVLGSKGAETNGFVVRHKKSGVTIRIKGDQPPVQFNLWGNSRALCPEPFAGIHLEPGESMRWTIEFRFSKD